MNFRQRMLYVRDLWPAACDAQGWRISDDAKRREVTAECMRQIGAPETTSTKGLRQEAITALFTYLRHLGNPDHLGYAAQWNRCLSNYRAENQSRQADHHEMKAFGPEGSRRLRKQRFGTLDPASGQFRELDPDEVESRLITMRERRRARECPCGCGTNLKMLPGRGMMAVCPQFWATIDHTIRMWMTAPGISATERRERVAHIRELAREHAKRTGRSR